MNASTWIPLVAAVVAAYLTLNIVGTVYYVKVNKLQGVSFSENAWDLSSVLLGWLLFPPLNLSSPISYSIHKK